METAGSISLRRLGAVRPVDSAYAANRSARQKAEKNVFNESVSKIIIEANKQRNKRLTQTIRSTDTIYSIVSRP